MTYEAGSTRGHQIVPALFGLMTARFEDAAALTAEGQNPATDHRRLAGWIASLVEEASILTDAIVMLSGVEEGTKARRNR